MTDLSAAKRNGKSRLTAIGSLIAYAEYVDAETGPGDECRQHALDALRTLGVRDHEIAAAERKAARR